MIKAGYTHTVQIVQCKLLTTHFCFVNTNVISGGAYKTVGQLSVSGHFVSSDQFISHL